MIRMDGRASDALRPVKITRRFIRHAEGSVLIEMGETRVICTATVESRVPPFLKDSGRGWITAEYGMLPRSASERIVRESIKGKVGGRTHEIQRLIGRSMRSVVDMGAMGERTIMLDCDVLQADGGTRTASITGSFIALVDALDWMGRGGLVRKIPVSDYLAAVSVGILDGEVILDLCYDEDSRVQVDMNVVMTGNERFIEVQGTAEGNPYTRKELDEMLSSAGKGIQELIGIQREIIGDILRLP
ncbi:MAG: ribonuclease PH [bacterium]